MSEIYVNIQGRVGSDVEYRLAGQVPIASFRLGSNPRQFVRDKGWIDRPTTWFTVECWRSLAENVKDSLIKGQPVVVVGKLKTTEWHDSGGTLRSRTVLDASAIGHDLSRGTAVFSKRTSHSTGHSTSLEEEMRELSEYVDSQAEANPFPPHGADDSLPEASPLPHGTGKADPEEEATPRAA
ncbi:single-stranded DNA-binding protein [Kribbella deserti]|uniref:Single-stranded DNA-binding protein n=1 Tax=Kribbella deserti TaxID=1926257 RepID=A0ABV6QD75_9ACTN